MRTAFTTLALMAVSVPASAASFNCGKAVTSDEKTVCADTQLSALDDLLPFAYSQAKKTTTGENVPQIARDFLADRRACGANSSCILSTYLSVIEYYQSLGAKVKLPDGITALTIGGADPKSSKILPTQIGQCVTTEISQIAPRLQSGNAAKADDYDSGTTVSFFNGGYQVSYERETSILTSRINDKTAVCLISIPHHCPPNDNRGRIYISTNIRTHSTWTLPDSQHSCGGA